MGTDGIYTHTAAYEQDPSCPICSPGVPFEVKSSMTLKEVWHYALQCNAVGCKLLPSKTLLLSAQVIDAIAKERQLEQPSISCSAENLYMHGPLEELTRGNLTKVSYLCLQGVALHNHTECIPFAWQSAARSAT